MYKYQTKISTNPYLVAARHHHKIKHREAETRGDPRFRVVACQGLEPCTGLAFFGLPGVRTRIKGSPQGILGEANDADAYLLEKEAAAFLTLCLRSVGDQGSIAACADVFSCGEAAELLCAGVDVILPLPFTEQHLQPFVRTAGYRT